MARPIRIEFSGALYHITSRGDRRENIYEDDQDRGCFLAILEQVIKDYNWICYAYCLMNNHYHLVIETPDSNLSKGMRQINGVFTQTSNRRHGRSGHLFQGRYKSILIDAECYFLELTRYVVLNPVRAGLVELPEQWHWSSYKAVTGENQTPQWLSTDLLLSQISTRPGNAVKKYQQFVLQGIGQESIWTHINRQVFLGDDDFVLRMQHYSTSQHQDVNIPKAQRRPPAPPLAEIAKNNKTRNEAILSAYATGEYSYQQIGEYFNLHFSTVGRIVRSSTLKLKI